MFRCRSRFTVSRLFTFIATFALLVTGNARAATYTWDTSTAPGIQGGGGTWNTTNTNWTTDGGASNVAWGNSPTFADEAIFGGTGGVFTFGPGLQIGAITFNSAYSLSGSGNSGITLGGAHTITVTTGITFTYTTGIGGTVGLIKAGGGTLIFNNFTKTFTGGIQLDAGILSATTEARLGDNDIFFNGGTYQILQSSGNPIVSQTVTRNFFGMGGAAARIDTTLVQSAPLIITGTVGNSVTGGLIKTGTGTLYLNGPLNYTGPTAVSAGILHVNPVNITSAFTVSNGASLAVVSGNGGTTLTLPSLTLGSASSTLLFEFTTTTPSTTIAPLSITGSNGLTTSGATIQITDTQTLAAGTYRLISYNNTSQLTAGAFTLSLPSGTTGSLQYASNQVNLVINGNGTRALTWGGQTSAAWNAGSAPNVGGTNNWRLAGSSTNFVNGDSVTFDDTATGNFNVSLALSMTPSAVTVNNSTNAYSITGSSGFGGTYTLTKTGTNSITLGTPNTYTGGTNLTEGTLVYARAPLTSSLTSYGSYATGTISSSPIGTGTLTIGGGATLTVDATRVIPNRITITGTAANPSIINVPSGFELTTTNFNFTGGPSTVLNKTGAGLLRITNGSQALNAAAAPGTVIINGGTVQVTDSASGVGNLYSDLIVVNNTGKFVFASNPPFSGENPGLGETTFLTVNTGGEAIFHLNESYSGLNLFGGTYTATNTSASTTQFQIYNTSELQSGTITSLNTNAATFIGVPLVKKTTGGTVTITGVALNTTGGLNLENGMLSTDTVTTSGGPVTFGTTSPTKGILQYRGTNGTFSTTGETTITSGGGEIQVTLAGTTLSYAGNLTGIGPLTKTGPGTLHLTGTLGSTGTTSLSNGTLRVNPFTASGAFTVATGSTLAVNSGGGTSSFSVPALTLDGSTSTLRFELTTGSAPSTSLLTITGSDAFNFSGGILQVTNTQTFGNGTYKLIGYNGTQITSGFTLSLPGGTTGALDYSTANQINLIITGGSGGIGTIKWGGQVDGVWNAGSSYNVGGTQNWRLVSDSSTSNYVNSNNVTFDDTASGNFTITLPGTVTPSAVTVNNSTNNYTITGTGSIAGGTALTKSGAGRLTLTTANTYIGGTNIIGGALVYAANPSTTTTTVNGGYATGTVNSSPIGRGTLTIGPGGTLTVDATRVIANPITITGNSANPAVIDVPTGFELTATNATFNGGTGAVLNKVGNGLLRITNGSQTPSNSVGTININGGTLELNDSAADLGNLGSNLITVSNAGSKFVFGTTPSYPGENPGLPDTTIIAINTGAEAVFHHSEQFGGINLQGGTFSTPRSNANHWFINASILQRGLVTGVSTLITIDGSVRKTTADLVTFTDVILNGSGSLSIQEGTLSTDSSITGTGVLTFGTIAPTKGILEYRGPTASMSKPATVTAGGGGIDVSTAATTLTYSGNLSGVGQLTKGGPGILFLTGSLGNTGGATVSEGILLVNPVTATGPFAVDNGGILAVNSGTGTASLNLPGLILDSSSTVRFDLFTGSVTSVPLISLVNSLTLLNSGATLEITNTQNMAEGTYTLFSYSGTTITSGFNLVLPDGVSGSLQYLSNQIRAVITTPVSGSDIVKWGGQIDGVWNIGTAPGVGGTFNWRLVGPETSHNFLNGDTVTFDDTASGNFSITIPGLVSPSSMTVSNTTHDYSFTGNGGIGGSGGLVKSGSGKLTLATANTYGNGTSLAGGVLVYARGPVTNGTTTFGGFASGTITSSPIGIGALTIGGGTTLTVDATRVIPNAITIAGTSGSPSIINVPNGFELTTTNATFNGGASAVLNKTGTGLLRITNGSVTTSSSIGTVIIDGGTVQLTDPNNAATGSGALGATSIVVNNTGKFVFGSLPSYTNETPNLPDAAIITINAGGTAEFNVGDTLGAIQLLGGSNFNFPAQVAQTVTLTQTSILESGTIFSPYGTGSFGGAGLVRKTTAGTVTVLGAALNGTGGLNIEEGVLSTTSAIGATGTLTLGTASTVGTLSLTGTTGSSLGAKPISVVAGGGVIEVSNSNANYTSNGAISGSPLSKTGPGTLTLTGANSATTTVNGGIMAGTATFTAVTPVTVKSGGTILPGTSTTAVGTMNLQGGLTVESGGTLGLYIAATNTPVSDSTMMGLSSAGSTPTANSFLTLSGTSSFTTNTHVAINATGANFSIGSTYSYVVAQGTGIPSGLSITAQSQFTTTGFTGSNFSLKSTADGKLIVSYVAESVILPPQPPQIIRFAVIGDYGVDNNSQLTVATRLKSLAPTIEFLTTVGGGNYFVGSTPATDFANWDRTQGKYYAQWIKLPTTALGSTQTSAYAAQGAASNNFYPLLGNSDLDEGAASYKDYFKNTPAGQTDKNYYKFTRGPVEFFMLSSDPREDLADGRAKNSEQYNWAKANIQASTAKYKVVQFHHPAYTFMNTALSTDANVPMREWEFKEWGTTAVFVGHNRNMQALDVGGLPYFLVGSAGQSRNSITSPQSPSPDPALGLWYNDVDLGFALVDATDTEMTVTFMRATDGYILYSQTIPAAAAVPEPGSILLLAGGALALGRVAVRRYRR